MNGSSPAVFHPISDIDAMDLSRHALVEASAGTGKTYTIENLVVRLLKEDPHLNLENILLVTFTEKATSELKVRIRQKIEQTLDSSPHLNDAVRKKLALNLDGFDNAAIYTIHGFCHTLLKEFPFETGNLFQQEVIDDCPLLEKLLRAQMRSDWPRRYGQRLDLLLALSDFSANPDGFIRTAVNLAQRISGDSTREIVIPDPAALDIEELWQTTQQTVLTLKSMVGPPPRFSDSYGRLNINSRTKAAIIRDMVEPIEQALERADGTACSLSAVMAVVATLGARHSSGERNIDRLVPHQWLKAGENLHECPNLTVIVDRLDELVSLFARLSHVLMLNAVFRLREDARTMKMKNGWLSYQDMLTRVAAFLEGERAEEGIRKIRNRYRVAFVDEFQDTDAVQWQIFSTLFLHGHEETSPNRLFLIGDPKQAIYAFRGADVFTYLDARQRMKILARRGMANLYDLTVNWRSTPQLVDCFNRMFSHDLWFGGRKDKGPFEIGYLPSGSPDTELMTSTIGSDRSRRPPFNVIDLTAAKSHAAAKAQLASFICREIRYLVGQGGISITRRDGPDRALHFGDIAILVRGQSEFSLIEPLLKESSIPYAYYRKPGLFQCREAHLLNIMLRAVCNPEQAAAVRMALLTSFFDIPPTALASRRELPSDHISQRLLAHWHNLSQRRRWGPLFQSLMEDSGLYFRHCTDPVWGRAESNFQQLFDYLEASAYARNLDIGGLVAMLDRLRLADVGAGSDDDIHQIEDEGEKVQVLTMHVSKGLEFPVVFVGGGLTVRNDGGMHVYHTVDPVHPERGCRKVIDLTASTGQTQAQKEAEDEDKRLYYVALTRARFKLYIPFFPDSRSYPWQGPICRFVSESIRQTVLNGGYGSLPGSGWHEAAIHAAEVAEAICAEAENEVEPLPLATGHLLPRQLDFRHRKISLESFSSISHRMVQSPEGVERPITFRLIDAAGREDDEGAMIITTESSTESIDPGPPDGLPGGTRMGSMFHHIFEHIDFQRVLDGSVDILADDGTRMVIESALALYRIEPRWAPPIARMVTAALKMPIDAKDPPLVLGRLASDQRRHEMEFYFPLVAPFPRQVWVPGCTLSGDSCSGMVVRGFIDLVFSWQGRYYIADWKSNRLDAGYDQPAMARAMAMAGYELQYRLYTIATLRWLKRQLGDRFDPNHHFGGVYYLFIRGMAAGGQDGIFYVPPEQLLPLEALQESIHKQIADL